MKNVLLILALAFAVPALAGGQQPPPEQDCVFDDGLCVDGDGFNSEADAEAEAEAIARANQGQLQGQQQGQAQGQIGINRNANDVDAYGGAGGQGGAGGSGSASASSGIGDYDSEIDNEIDSDIENENRNHNDVEIDTGDVSAGAGVFGSGNSRSGFEINDELLDIENGLINDSGNSKSASGAVSGSASGSHNDIEIGETRVGTETDVEVGGQNTSVGNEATSENHNAATTEHSGNSANSFDFSDHSTSSYTYQEVYRAPNLSTQLNTTTSACVNFLGIQGTAAGDDGAGGVGLGFPLADRECRLGKAAVLAFQMGNYEAGWVAFCSQKSVRKAWAGMLKAQGEHYRGRGDKAIMACKMSGIDVEATRRNAMAELAELRGELLALQQVEGYDDTELRMRIGVLERVAHRPNETFLLHGTD